MRRRQFIRTAGWVTGTAALAGEAGADHGEENPTPADGTEGYQAKVAEIRAPLSGVPTVEETGGTLRVELDDEVGVDDPEAVLDPSFGAGEAVTLERTTDPAPGTSDIWNADEGEDDSVVVAEYRVPEASPSFTPGLYDLRVSWNGGSDRQPRAVSVHESIPAEPEVVVIADPQLGDPRALQTAGQEARNDRSPEPFVDRTRKGFGTPTERWGATRRAVAEVNAADPDLVLVAGDLTFGQDAPGKYYAEYEDAWEILNLIRAPTFCTIGNHDGYVQSGVDGRELYRQTFGPPSYSVDVGDVHVVAVDTYDWSYLDRTGGSFAVSTYGGQVREPQLQWLRDDLESWRADNDGAILAVGHHNPSWQPDPVNRAYDGTDGTPVAEQTGRGSRYFESGQLWTGENLFALRDLLDQVDVTAFFAGHSHRDRLARTVPSEGGPADVVETHAPRTSSPGYHLVDYSGGPSDGDDEYREFDWTVEPGETSDGDVVDTLRSGGGTLYVGCTTSQSSTGEYWGWRPLTVDAGSRHLDPADFGYPWSAEGEDALDDRAVSPDAWSAAQDEVGLYSHPSYRLAVERVEESGDRAVVRVHNDLAVDLEGGLQQTLADSPGLKAENAEVEWRRHAGDEQEVKVAFTAPANETLRIVLETRGTAADPEPL
jgi:3',5'-cyclic AMP phosphodiesterase CpdA